MSEFIGKKVIVRSDRAGVFFGTLVKKENGNVLMKDVRKLWEWYGACAVEEISQIGTINPNDCKFTVVVPEMEIESAIQIIPCTDKAIKVIEGVKAWKKG